MKNMKKILALVLVALLVVANVAALAADDQTPATPADNTITVEGLEKDDNVKYYKVIEFDATTETGWKFTEQFSSLSAATLTAILENGITDETATAIAAKATTPVSNTADVVGETGIWTKSDVAPGLYMVVPVPTNADVIYNPVFVAVQSDNAGGKVALPLSYDNNGTAKKSDVTLDKTTKPAGETDYDTHTDTNVGDLIDYKIVTTVPAYLEAYTNPHFTLSDSLSTGLTFATGVEGAKTKAALTVKVGEDTLDAKYYDVTFADDQHYTLNFTKEYLQSRTSATVVTVTYQAKITADAYNVNPEDNTATIDYSNNPSDTNGHDTKTDKTKHYTFDIDASLIGDTEYTTSELIKVGGKFVNGVFVPDVEEHTYSNKTKHNPLADAEFKLYTNEACTDAYLYSNANFAAGTIIKSDANGLLNIKGLDAGTYWLKETKAPAGYVTIKDAAKFQIIPTYATEFVTDADGATYKPLVSYQVLVNDTTASTYTFDNGTKTVTKKQDGTAGDNSTELQNVRGTELPSTGGMGTTILYVGGSILVILAAVLLITKRRMNADE